MPQPTPPLIEQAFAADAAAPYIQNPIPVAAGDPGRASFELGFPPQTMTEILAGGTPPFGQDVNGILYMLSAHIAALQAGQPYLFDATLAASMGGYAAGTVLGMADGSGLWINTIAANTTDPDGVSAAGWMPLFSQGFASIGSLIGGVRTLTPAEYRRGVIVLAGVLVGNLQVIVPSGAIGARSWLIVNTTSGAFTTTVKTAGGTGVTIPQGGFSAPVEVYGDGTNVYPTVAPLSVPLDVNPAPSTIPVRNNVGQLFATYFNSSSGLENPTIGAVIVQNSAADGYLRKISLANFAAQISLSSFAGTVSNGQVPQSAVTQYAAAILANAALTGTPTAPTAPVGTNTTQVATTAFVRANQIKVACGRIVGGVLQAGSMGVTSITATGFGSYDIDVTAAGFSAIPAPTASINIAGTNPDTAVINAISSVLLQARTVFGGTAVNRDFNFIAIGL